MKFMVMEKLMYQKVFKFNTYVLVLFFLVGCGNFMYNNDELKDILGVDVKVQSKLYSYEEISGMQGEGYILNQYLLSDETVVQFKDLKDKQSFPKMNSYKKGWELLTWNNFSFYNSNILNLLTVFEQHNNTELLEKVRELKMDITQKDNFYSIFYKDSLNDPYAVEFYILNPHTKTLWVVNIIT